MKTPGHRDPGGDGQPLTDLEQRRVLDAAQLAYVSELSSALRSRAYELVQQRLGDMLNLSHIALSDVVICRRADQDTDEELGGGLLMDHTESDPELGNSSLGLYVPVYEIDGGRVREAYGFTIDQAEELALSVDGIVLACTLDGVEVHPDLTRLASEPDLVVLDASPVGI